MIDVNSWPAQAPFATLKSTMIQKHGLKNHTSIEAIKLDVEQFARPGMKLITMSNPGRWYRNFR